MFQVTIRATSIIVTPGQDALTPLAPLLQLHEYEDEFQEEVKVLGYMYDEQHDRIFLHKGIDINYLRRLLGECEIKYDKYHPYKEMNFEFEEIFPPKNDDQRDCIDFIAGEKAHAQNINDPQIFLVKEPGFGKMEPYSRKIPTPTKEGFTYMGNLKIGDFVFDENGKPTKVIGIYDHGVQKVYEITFADGRIALCGGDHLWKIFHKAKDNPIVVSTYMLKDIYRTLSTAPSRLNSNRDKYQYNCAIPTCKPLEYPHVDAPVDPWVFGCFIGNGCCRELALTISSADDEVPKKIAKIYGFTYKRNSELNYSYTFYHENGKRVSTSGFFNSVHEILNKYSYEKTIPDVFMYNDIDTRLQLLQGLMDTDGSISFSEGRYHVTYSSTSRKLLEQIQWIVYSLGWSATIVTDKRKEKYSSGFCGTLIFRMPNRDKHKLFTYKPKLSIAKRAILQHQHDFYSTLLIKNIRVSHMEECRCIMVDNPSHLYLTENCIVTHNTFCTGYGIGVYGSKALIIMHQDTLRSQWRDSLYNMNGYTSHDVYELTSSAELEQIANGDLKLDYDVYLMTHATFLAACNRIRDTEKIGLISRNLAIGIKVIDEAHLHFRNTLMIDFLFNVRRNLYLTATDGRSSKDENAIFRHVFSNTTFYRKQTVADDKHPAKWVEYVTVNINTHLNPNIYRYRVNGGRGMSGVTYGKWVITPDKRHRHFKVCRDLLKEIYANVGTAKVIIFLPLIELCTECAYFLSMELDNDPKFDYSLSIKTINSHNTKSENEYNKRADVIVTTIQSIGTGQDIKGITDIICCSPFVSKITSKQVFGRIRYINKPCHYYDIVDQSVPADVYWWKSRARTLKSLAVKYMNISWEEDINDSSKANT